jgi:uncharacterized Fe-S cluster-containing radical SAM superfamily enzyme
VTKVFEVLHTFCAGDADHLHKERTLDFLVDLELLEKQLEKSLSVEPLAGKKHSKPSPKSTPN